MDDFLLPPEPVFRDYRDGKFYNEDWFKETTRQAGKLCGVVYACHDDNPIVLRYVGSGTATRPWRNVGSSDRVGTEVIEILAIARARFFATVLESLIVELLEPPGNKVKQILPRNRHLMERNAAVKFWNQNYAERFRVEAPWDYPWGASR